MTPPRQAQGGHTQIRPRGHAKDRRGRTIRAEGRRALKLRIFVDKSVVEVFANSRQAVMRRIYPSREDSVGESFVSTGGDAEVHTLEAYKIEPSNSY